MRDKLIPFFGEAWINAFSDRALGELDEIFTYLKERKQHATIVPEQKNLFRAFKETPLDQVKVLVLGQDPYHSFAGDVPVANGLAFSINEDVKDVFFLPPSLRNILSEIQNDVYPMSFDPERLSLNYKEEWGSRLTAQGVLLLNTALTVEEGAPEAHCKLWESFIECVMQVLAAQEKSIVWLLFGKHAHAYEQYIPKHHKVIKTSHPSPLGATKQGKDYPAFIGSRCFSTCNILLEADGQTPIKW